MPKIYTFKRRPTDDQRKSYIEMIQRKGYNVHPMTPSPDGLPKVYTEPRHIVYEFPEFFRREPCFSRN